MLRFATVTPDGFIPQTLQIIYVLEFLSIDRNSEFGNEILLLHIKRIYRAGILLFIFLFKDIFDCDWLHRFLGVEEKVKEVLEFYVSCVPLFPIWADPQILDSSDTVEDLNHASEGAEPLDFIGDEI